MMVRLQLFQLDPGKVTLEDELREAAPDGEAYIKTLIATKPASPNTIFIGTLIITKSMKR